MEKFLSVFCKTVLNQFKIPRKGVMMWLLILSSITIAINKCIFHYSIAPKGSFLLQLLYFLWFYSFASIPIKAYNEYCDKKDKEREEEINRQNAEKKLNEYFEIFDYCIYEEKELLARFYINQITSLHAEPSEIATLITMRQKGITFISYDGSRMTGGRLTTDLFGLKLINSYFDRHKPQFFELIESLDKQEIDLLQEFVDNNDEQIEICKKKAKIAKLIIGKFENAKFDDIYINEEGFFTISTLYLAYLERYFENKD